jgi:hypothetical protein
MLPFSETAGSQMYDFIVFASTQRPNQSLAVVMIRFDLMKQFSILRKLAAASGGSAPSR